MSARVKQYEVSDSVHFTVNIDLLRVAGAFVMLGFGATVAMLVSSFPVIVVLSQHKDRGICVLCIFHSGGMDSIFQTSGVPDRRSSGGVFLS